MITTKDKLLAFLSYLGIIGWIIVLVVFQNETPKNNFLKFHLRQSLGIILLSLAGGFVFYLLARMFNLWFVLNAFSFIIFMYWVLGIVYALTGSMRFLPYIGDYFDEQLSFIQ
ncbi:MAG: hypothetical protein GXO47_09990 [Chlorobi bacterium]|nr:hypothetical protein [Chlorobiota bacterium]